MSVGTLIKLDAHLTFKIWGGSKLSGIKGVITDIPLGETWEVSTHKSGPSMMGTMPLNKICQLSYLVKFIDTADNLSIQVHPGDEYAQKHENEKGKAECWIILDSDLEAQAGIYLGFKPGVNKKEFKTALTSDLDIQTFLNFIPVKTGDFFYVPPGTIHAIGAGVTLAEVQQSSGITYRVWDWNRLDDQGNSRELHVDKACDVLDFSDKFNADVLAYNKSLLGLEGIHTIHKHEDFKVDLVSFQIDQKLDLNLKNKESIIILEGSVIVDDMELNAYESAIALNDGQVHFSALQHTRLLIVRE